MPHRALALLFIATMAAYSALAQETPPADPAPDSADAKVGPSFRGDSVPTSAVFIFKYENAQLQPASFQITLHANGAGHFVSQVGAVPPTDIADLPPEPQDLDIAISNDARDRIFAVARKEHGFAMKCESNASKIAFQGIKTLTYDGPDAHGSCSFNYSTDARIQWLTTEMLGIAATLEEGRRLAMEHKHGRLTLDPELETLTTMVKSGDATEIQNIASTLQAIMADENVIMRARRRAQALLDTAPLK